MVSFRPQIWVFLTKNRCFWVIFHFWRHFHLHIESEFSGKRFEKLKLRSTRWILRNFRIFGGYGGSRGVKKNFFRKIFFRKSFQRIRTQYVAENDAKNEKWPKNTYFWSKIPIFGVEMTPFWTFLRIFRLLGHFWR